MLTSNLIPKTTASWISVPTGVSFEGTVTALPTAVAVEDRALYIFNLNSIFTVVSLNFLPVMVGVLPGARLKFVRTGTANISFTDGATYVTKNIGDTINLIFDWTGYRLDSDANADFQESKIETLSMKNLVVADVNQTTPTGIDWDTASVVWPTSTAIIPTSFWFLINETGEYTVMANVFGIGGTNTQRKSVELRVNIWATPTSVRASWYMRMAQGHNESSCYILEHLSLTAGQIIRITWQRGAGSGVVQVPVATSILVIQKTW